jgi:hypothetical protein
MNVPVPDLNDVTKDIEFLMNIAQQASAATSAQQGVVEQSPVTLGEVQLTLNNAQQRVKAMSKYYNAAWEDFGLKFVKFLEAAPDKIDPITINKKGRLTDKNYTKTITPAMWFAKNGYEVECKMKEDVQSANLDSLQKLEFAKTLMPMNNNLNKVIKKKSLELADIPAGEMAEILKEDEMQTQALLNAPPAPTMAGTPPGGATQSPPMTPNAPPVVQPAVMR